MKHTTASLHKIIAEGKVNVWLLAKAWDSELLLENVSKHDADIFVMEHLKKYPKHKRMIRILPLHEEPDTDPAGGGGPNSHR